MLQLLAVALVCSSPSAPQELDPVWRDLAVSSLTFRDAEAGELTGDGVEDVVLLRGDQLLILHGPAWYATEDDLAFADSLAAEVSDAIILPGAGPDDADAVAAVGQGGLEVWEKNQQGGWNAETLDGPWSGLGRIGVWAVPGAEVYLMIVSSEDGSQLFPFLYHRLTGSIVLLLSTVNVPAGPIDDLLLVNGDDDTTPDIALVRPGGLDLLAIDGTLLHHLSAVPVDAGGFAAVLETPDAMGERVAWVTGSMIYSTNWLLVLHQSQGVYEVEQPVDLGPAPVTALESGDWDLDEQPDLCVANGSTAPLRVFRNQGGTFDAGAFDDVLVGPSQYDPVSPVSVMLLHDLDHDGDADGFFLDDTRPGGVLHRSQAFSSDQAAPMGLDFEQPTETGEPKPIVSTDEWTVSISVPVDDASFPPVNATHVEVVAWHAGEGPNPVATGGEPDGHFQMPVADIGTNDLHPVVTFPQAAPGVEETSHEWILEVRYARHVTGEPVVAYPPRFDKVVIEARWPDEKEPPKFALLLLPPGNPIVRGDLEPLDEVPPYEETPEN